MPMNLTPPTAARQAAKRATEATELSRRIVQGALSAQDVAAIAAWHDEHTADDAAFSAYGGAAGKAWAAGFQREATVSQPKNKPSRRVYHAALAEPWLMDQEHLQLVLDVIQRHGDSEAGESLAATREALAAKLGKPVENTGIQMRDGVAILSVEGAIFRRANLFTAYSGGCSTELLARDFAAAVADPSAKAILLCIDSPGGSANGINELAQMIYDARSVKPVVAYVGNLAASAGYWLACACSEIVIDATALLGSIGVVVGMDRGGDEDVIEFVSSQSPYKRIDPESDDGKMQMQALVDATAQVFVDAVARNRNVTAETVLQQFGRGGMLVGKDAVAAGMADRLGSFEQVMTELNNPVKKKTGTSTVKQIQPSVASVRTAIQPIRSKSMSDNIPAVTVAVPLPTTTDPVMQAQLNDYAAQMQIQMRQQHETMMAQARDQAAAEFERWKAEMSARQQIETFAARVTSPTIQRPHALPFTAEAVTTFLMSVNADARKTAMSMFDQVLESGLVSFEEIGASGEGRESQSAIERYEEAIAAKTAKGLSRGAAASAVMSEQPELVRAMNAERNARKGK